MPLLEVEDLAVYYPVKSGIWGKKKMLKAVDGVSFTIERGDTVGLVGESGCGKSTLGRAVVKLEEPCRGAIRLDGVDMASVKGSRLRKMRQKFQMIFQDPYGSLNPRMTVFAALDEVISLHRKLSPEKRRAQAVELLELVGLPPEALDRYPHQFSGGQRQRIGIARALALEPDLVVADEPVSALDVSIQAQILNLLGELQEKFGLTYIFITHDLSVVRYFADDIAVMYLGQLVEKAPAEELFENPLHPYTQALLKAVPKLGSSTQQLATIPGQVPMAGAFPAGCRFSDRCSYAVAECKTLPVMQQHNHHCWRCIRKGSMEA